jgi:putative SOS response-associated peptidase YedK
MDGCGRAVVQTLAIQGFLKRLFSTHRTGRTGRTTQHSFTIITTSANDLLAPLHDRMPVVIAPDSWAEWLGEKAVPEPALKAMLKPYPGDAMMLWPVDRRIGDVRNDDPDLFAPFVHTAPTTKAFQ